MPTASQKKKPGNPNRTKEKQMLNYPNDSRTDLDIEPEYDAANRELVEFFRFYVGRHADEVADWMRRYLVAGEDMEHYGDRASWRDAVETGVRVMGAMPTAVAAWRASESRFTCT